MNDVTAPPSVDRRPPAPRNNTAPLLTAALATATVLAVMSMFFWFMAETEPPDEDALAAAEAASAPTPTPTPTPTPVPSETPDVVPTPPAPVSNKLSSDEWLLSPYAILRENGNLVITGTLQNRAGQARSAVVRVFVYVGGEPVAAGSTKVVDVPAGESVDIALPSGATWSAGNKVLLVQTEELP